MDHITVEFDAGNVSRFLIFERVSSEQANSWSGMNRFKNRMFTTNLRFVDRHPFDAVLTGEVTHGFPSLARLQGATAPWPMSF